MPLESATHIADLNTSNPVGSTDKVQTLDDHVRLIKSTIKTTFPNVNGAVNFTPAQANILVTDGAGAGMLADIAAIADPGADRVLGWDESANAAIAFSFSTGITSSGTAILIDTTVVPTLSANNTFTGASLTLSSSANPTIAVTDTTTPTTTQLFCDNSNGYVGTSTNHALSLRTNAANRLTISAAGDYTFNAGTVTTSNASASEVGFKGVPQNNQDGNYTLVLTDCGKTIYKAAGGAGETITIPANASVAFPVGTQIDIVNNGGGDLTIAITSDTLSWVVGGATGSRTLGDHGWAVLKKVASTEWFISGANLT